MGHTCSPIWKSVSVLYIGTCVCTQLKKADINLKSHSRKARAWFHLPKSLGRSCYKKSQSPHIAAKKSKWTCFLETRKFYYFTWTTAKRFLERCQGTCEEKLQNVWFRHIQQHGAKILRWATMYQAASDSKEECCLPAFQPKGKYSKIPLILPDSDSETRAQRNSYRPQSGCFYLCSYQYWMCSYIFYRKANLFTHKDLIIALMLLMCWQAIQTR